ncbi:chorismate lyase [Bartonella krasnovii]|uniref:Probable chorismate pyruvate-lyase n=1 Tax=Bartonella krasnovii TaxID=2267275 RepID=A0A5B9D273_9HYPH|nr:chorismate lyase [Bartonella krasnovii]QEE12500.1 chorismate lyase [Bartonella krasnovii]UNF28593.1 chorismate lyase [Bartonella krasnovii]UNF34971.1 chorismate lyase [Bartonella krasnovii]UNF36608.1 chorismate lyase [Bartonella krasnovii]UNF38241.1 chorismate lyase [Bartonella krasnovii]
MSDLEVSILPSLKWLFDQNPPIPENIRDWLMESGSMTLRLKKYCTCFQVQQQRECFITRDKLKEEAEHLPKSARYWLREVILIGDNKPWLLGRTVIPQETLHHNQALMHLGTIPLGHYLFNSEKLTRDYIHIGQQGTLWARRSRLRLTGEPLLLTELFLKDSPLYSHHQ